MSLSAVGILDPIRDIQTACRARRLDSVHTTPDTPEVSNHDRDLQSTASHRHQYVFKEASRRSTVDLFNGTSNLQYAPETELLMNHSSRHKRDNSLHMHQIMMKVSEKSPQSTALTIRFHSVFVR